MEQNQQIFKNGDTVYVIMRIGVGNEASDYYIEEAVYFMKLGGMNIITVSLPDKSTLTVALEDQFIEGSREEAERSLDRFLKEEALN